jgi:hypothetical protein
MKKNYTRAWSMGIGSVMITLSSIYYQEHAGFYVGWALFHVAVGEALYQWDK